MNTWSDHAKGLMLAFTGILVLTPDSLLVRLIETDTWTLLFWRGLFTFLTLAAYVVLTRPGRLTQTFTKMTRKEWGVGILFAINTILFVVSIRNTSVANTLVILSTAPLVSAVMSSLFLGEHAPLRTWLTAILGVVCIAIIMGGSIGETNLLGDSAAVGVAITLGSNLTLLRHGHSTGTGIEDPLPYLAIGGLLAALMVLPWAAPFSLTGLNWLYAVLLGCVVMPVSFMFTSKAPRYLPAPEVGLIFLLETVLGPLWVWLVLNEVPPTLTFIGGAILLTALAAHTALALRAGEN